MPSPSSNNIISLLPLSHATQRFVKLAVEDSASFKQLRLASLLRNIAGSWRELTGFNSWGKWMGGVGTDVYPGVIISDSNISLAFPSDRTSFSTGEADWQDNHSLPVSFAPTITLYFPVCYQNYLRLNRVMKKEQQCHSNPLHNLMRQKWRIHQRQLRRSFIVLSHILGCFYTMQHFCSDLHVTNRLYQA